MYKVFTNDNRQYVGCSKSMAEQFYDAAVETGRMVMMLVRKNGEWQEVKEHVL